MQRVGNFATFLPLNWLPWQRPLRNRKTGPNQENSRKYLPFGEKIIDTEIALLIFKKKIKMKKKLQKVKYIARSASLPSRLNKILLLITVLHLTSYHWDVCNLRLIYGFYGLSFAR